MANSKIDGNFEKTIIGTSSVDGETPINVAVNPSTGAILTEAAAGSATSAKQDSQITLETQLNSLIDTLQELTQRLSPLAGAMNSTAQLRVVATGAVTATGGGYITSAQEVAALLTQTTSLINSLRPPLDNNLAIQSNINNAVGV